MKRRTVLDTKNHTALFLLRVAGEAHGRGNGESSNRGTPDTQYRISDAAVLRHRPGTGPSQSCKVHKQTEGKKQEYTYRLRHSERDTRSVAPRSCSSLRDTALACSQDSRSRVRALPKGRRGSYTRLTDTNTRGERKAMGNGKGDKEQKAKGTNVRCRHEYKWAF